MTNKVLVAGAGIGGLAAGVAAARAGWQACLYEQAAELSEIGAGIQLGPNATRILAQWGLAPSLREVSACPQSLNVRSAADGSQLGSMPLGDAFQQCYGAPYVSVHRADLQSLLLRAAREAGVRIEVSARATVAAGAVDAGQAVLRINDTHDVAGDALVAADGLWSAVRHQVFADGPPAPTGHVAYRALAEQSALPAAVRSHDVTVWLGPRLHVVAYPVRQGQHLNVVAIVEGHTEGDKADWNQAGVASQLRAAMGPLCAPLQALVEALPAWRVWVLHERRAVRSADEMARDRVALLGDAAHPMRPYLAQGAGMAIEDASELARVLGNASSSAGVPAALRQYASNRWERCARVQARAERNGRIFHATGLVRWGRDLSMRLLGERLLDQPWLYGFRG